MTSTLFFFCGTCGQKNQHAVGCKQHCADLLCADVKNLLTGKWTIHEFRKAYPTFPAIHEVEKHTCASMVGEFAQTLETFFRINKEVIHKEEVYLIMETYFRLRCLYGESVTVLF
jgi:hypothetical protein